MKTQNKNKRSVLHYAAANNNTESASVFPKFLNSMEKKSLDKNDSCTALYWSCSKGHLEFSKWLLEEYKNCITESDPLLHTAQENDGNTPLMLAAANHNL